MENVKEQHLLVDLDALLDTRLATLNQVDNNLAVRALNKDYFNRKCDDWNDMFQQDDINESYRLLWSNRDVETLKQSFMAKSVFLIAEIAMGWVESQVELGVLDKITVDINFSPYEDLDEISRNLMSESLHEYLPPEVIVNCVYYPVQKLTPQFLNNKYSAWIVYEFNEWLSHHIETLANNAMVDFTIFAPALFPDKVPNENLLPEHEGNKMNPFRASEILFAEFVAVSLLSADYFSIPSP